MPRAFNSIDNKLGAPLRYFPVRSLYRFGDLTVGLLYFTSSASAIFYGGYQAYLEYQEHGPAAIADKLIWPAIVAAILFLFGVIACRLAYVNWIKGIGLFKLGFAIRDRKGIQTWRWEDIEAIKANLTRHYLIWIHLSTSHVYTLQVQSGKPVILNDFYVKVEELAKAIEESTFPLLYRRAAETYNTGQRLSFGPVTLAKEGLRIGRKLYPWEEIKDVALQQGALKISKTDGGWLGEAHVAAASIPNLQVLLAIIRQVVGVQPS